MISIDLNNKVAIVTGVSSGIGKGIAKVMAQAGCNIAGCARAESTSQGIRDLEKDIRDMGKSLYYKEVDVTLEDALGSFVEGVIGEYGKIDVLISNAGVNIFNSAADCSVEDWEYNHKLNLKAHWSMSRFCRPYLAETNGSIVIMTSNHAYQTLPGCFPYNVTKTALTGLVRSLAIEWGPQVRINGIAPGFIETEGGKAWFNSFENPEQEKEKTINIHPAGRLGTVEEVGVLCAYLASNYARFITGATYLIDGGRSAVMQDI